jgi:hypothetical protein
MLGVRNKYMNYKEAVINILIHPLNIYVYWILLEKLTTFLYIMIYESIFLINCSCNCISNVFIACSVAFIV